MTILRPLSDRTRGGPCIPAFLAVFTAWVGLLDIHIARGAETGADALEEVVVTARQKEEPLQSVPLSISAFTSEDLTQHNVVDMRDIAALTPGFSFQNESGSGYTAPVIRGSTQLIQQNLIEQTVSFFLDGIYLPRNYLTNLGFDLLDRVEVVKGPQSARYGRNAFMGAVNYVSRTPTEDLHAEVDGTVGDHNDYIGTAFASGAIVPGVLRLYGGVDFKSFGGTWPNHAPFCNISFSTGTGCELGGYEHTTYNLQAALQVNDQLTADLSYYHFHFINQGNAQNWFGELGADSQELNCGQYNANVRPAGSGQLGAGGQWYRLYCGQVPAVSVPQDPRGYASQLDFEFMRGTINWKLGDYLTVHNLAGWLYASNSSLDYKDNPGCPFFIPGLCLFEDGPIGHVRQTSDELRVAFDSHGPLHGTLGVSYTDLDDYTTANFVGLPPLAAVPTAPTNVNDSSAFSLYAVEYRTVTEDLIWSPFGELSLSLLDDKLNIGYEARYQNERKTNIALPTAAGSGLGASGGIALAGTFHSYTPRYTVDYHLSPTNLVYASAAKGEQAGGFNVIGSYQPSTQAYGPDYNWTYEIGSKNKFFENRLLFNADVYYINWQHEQIYGVDPLNPNPLPDLIILNLGAVYSKGIELEAAVVPVSHLTVNGNLALNDARFARGTYDLQWNRAPGPAVCDNVVCNENGYIGGNQTPQSSKVQSALGAEWKDQFPFADAEYFLRADATYQSRQYNEDTNLSWIPGRTLVNTSLGLSAKRWDVQFWVRNLADLKYVSSVIVGQPNMQYNSYLGDRQTLGITAKFRY